MVAFRAMNTPQVLTFYPSPLTSPPRLLIAVLISLFVACLTSQARAVAVTARVAAIKGSATVSTPGGRETPLAQGDTVRAGSVISCSSGSGVLLRPAPRVSVVVFMSSKVRFDGTDMNPGGSANVRYSILVGRAMFTIEPSSDRSGGVNVSVSTDVGSVEGSRGSWTVNCEADRTSVAVGEGSTDVSIGGGATTANGTGGQIQVPEGSVIWLTRGAEGRVEAKVVNRLTGTYTVIGSDGKQSPPQKAPADLLDQSTNVLNNSGDSTSPTNGGGTGTGGGGTTPNQPNNPDVSTPKPDRPVVSPATP